MTTSDKQSKNGNTGTYLSHTHDDTSGGRFAAIGRPSVIGTEPVPAAAYPAASAAHQTELPPEPSLGFAIDAMPDLESSMASSSIEVTGDPADAPSSGSGPATPPSGVMSERAGSSSSPDKTNEGGSDA